MEVRPESYLIDNVHPVVELLSLEEGVHVVEEDQELRHPVPEGDDDGHIVLRPTGVRPPLSPREDGGVGGLQLR